VQPAKKQVIYQNRKKILIAKNRIKYEKTNSYKDLIEGFEQ